MDDIARWSPENVAREQQANLAGIRNSLRGIYDDLADQMNSNSAKLAQVTDQVDTYLKDQDEGLPLEEEI